MNPPIDRSAAPGRGPDLVVLDGFHAWKHANRFGAAIAEAYTDDRVGLERMVEGLAPDLATAARAVRVVLPGELAGTCTAWGVARPHHTRMVAVAQRPVDRIHQVAVRTGRHGRPLVLVDQPRSPGNLGAVVRVAAAADAAGVVVDGTLDIWQRDVVRGAAGLQFALPVGNLATWERGLLDGPVVILDPDGDDLQSVQIPGDSLLVVGAERAGVSGHWRERADLRVALPMRSGVSSLNLATSVSAMLYIMVMGRGVGAKS